MPTDLDELMDRDPMKLSDQDLDAIIAYQRKYRAQLEAGTVKRAKKPVPKLTTKIDISRLIGKKVEDTPAPKPTITGRRF